MPKYLAVGILPEWIYQFYHLQGSLDPVKFMSLETEKELESEKEGRGF